MFLNSESEQILEVSQRVFDDERDDFQLRSLCLHFLDLSLPANVADVRRVYLATSSDELRFAIEKAFAEVSGDLYASLQPPGGPVTSRVSVARRSGCAKIEPETLQVIEEYQEPSDRVEALRKENFYIEGVQPRMINMETGVATQIEGIKMISGWTSLSNGQHEFAIPRTTKLLPGRYRIALQISEKDKVQTGYGITAMVRRTANGNQIDIDVSAHNHRRMIGY